MADDFGLTFSPASAMNKDRAQANADPNGPVQEAIRTLSLRIPRVTGGKGIAPAPLLNSMGAQGLPTNGMGLEQILAMLFGRMQPQSPMGAPLSPQTAGFGSGQLSQPPMPNVTPGIEDPNRSLPPLQTAPVPRVTPGMEAPVGVGSQYQSPAPFKAEPDVPRMPESFGF